MSKYIIELNDDVQIVQKVGVTNNGNAFSIGIYKDILEQYTPVDVEKIYDKAYRDGYNKGLKDGKAVNDKGCEGCKYQANRELTCPCSECANNFKNQWAAKDDKIEVGDWVNIKNTDEELGIVTKEHGNQFYILWADGSSGLWSSKGVVKTGRHFDIDKILDEMKGTRTDDDTY